MTGYAQSADKQKATDAGIDAHLTKPPDMEKLKQLSSKQGPPPPPPVKAD